jgi:hypothetical protein
MDIEKEKIMNEAFRHLHMPPELACDFLAVFSRMEHALKATGTYAMDSGGKAAAKWDGFANAIDEPFRAIGDAGFIAAVDYLLTRPPRKQVFENGAVRFVDQAIDTKQRKVQQTLLMIRSVRNNLFHGGKHLPGGEMEPGRNRLLVSHSLTVLNHCIPLDADVRQNYEM